MHARLLDSREGKGRHDGPNELLPSCFLACRHCVVTLQVLCTVMSAAADAAAVIESSACGAAGRAERQLSEERRRVRAARDARKRQEGGHLPAGGEGEVG